MNFRSTASLGLKTFLVLVCFSFSAVAKEPVLGPLPSPVSNNAVAISRDQGFLRVFSFMGMGAKKTWDAITTSTYELDLSSGEWTEKHPVPGVGGRIAASAVAIHDQVFVFGGYMVDSHGEEITVSDLNVFVPAQDKWYRGRDIPIPVDDAAIGLFHDRYIFLIGGWSSKTGDAVRNVQIYDTDTNTWSQGTPLPGTPVFGHAGAIVGDTLVYIDGAYKNPNGSNPKYVASSECWMAKIPNYKNADVTKLTWSKLPEHPGTARYRIAAGPEQPDKKAHMIYFSGGTDNPYNFNGIGYNGQPSEPSPVTFAFDANTQKWETVSDNDPNQTMDLRGLLATPRGLMTLGGMEKGQKVTDKVTVIKPKVWK
jgi:N-acetylneuraminic acid mutarotase